MSETANHALEVTATPACASKRLSMRNSPAQVPLSSSQPGELEATGFPQNPKITRPSTQGLILTDATQVTPTLPMHTRSAAAAVESRSTGTGSGHPGVRCEPATERGEARYVSTASWQVAMPNTSSKKRIESPMPSQRGSDNQTGGASATCAASPQTSETRQLTCETQTSRLKEGPSSTAQGGIDASPSVKGYPAFGGPTPVQPLGPAKQKQLVQRSDAEEADDPAANGSTEVTPARHHMQQCSAPTRRNASGETNAAGVKVRASGTLRGRPKQNGHFCEGDAVRLSANASFSPKARGEGLPSVSSIEEQGDVIPLRSFLWALDAFPGVGGLSKTGKHQEKTPEDALVNCQLDDFELADSRSGGDACLLGRGTYGVVRKLRHRATGKVFAVKSIEKESVVRAGMVSQVEFELLVQKDLLRHRNVLRCFACMEDNEQVHLVLEYCSQGDLYSKIRSQPLRRLSEREAFVYFSQLVNGLHYLHSKGVTHRDLKLENLLLDGQNVLKIADLGWCGSVLGKRKNFNFCGTLDYLAPEMIQGVGHDWRVDLWGAGILLYEMLDGKPPFQSTRHLELIQQVLKAEVTIPPHIASDAGDLIAKLLRYDPEDRIPLHLLPQHPWVKRMWSELRSEYYAKYPDAVPRRSSASCTLSGAAPHCEKHSRASSASAVRTASSPRSSNFRSAPTPLPSFTRAGVRASHAPQKPAASQQLTLDGRCNTNAHRHDDATYRKAPPGAQSAVFFGGSTGGEQGTIRASASLGTSAGSLEHRRDSSVQEDLSAPEKDSRQASPDQLHTDLPSEKKTLLQGMQEGSESRSSAGCEYSQTAPSECRLLRGSTMASSVDSDVAERSKAESDPDEFQTHSTDALKDGARVVPPETFLEKNGHSLDSQSCSGGESSTPAGQQSSETLGEWNPNTGSPVDALRVDSSISLHSHPVPGDDETKVPPRDLHDDAAANLPSKKKKVVPSRVGPEAASAHVGGLAGARSARSLGQLSDTDHRRGGVRRSIAQAAQRKALSTRMQEKNESARAALCASLISRILDINRSTHAAVHAGTVISPPPVLLPTHPTARPSWSGSVRGTGAGHRATSSSATNRRFSRGGSKSADRKPEGGPVGTAAKSFPSKVQATQQVCKGPRRPAVKADNYSVLFEDADLSDSEKNTADGVPARRGSPLLEKTDANGEVFTGDQTESEPSASAQFGSQSRGCQEMSTGIRQESSSHLSPSTSLSNHGAGSQVSDHAPLHATSPSDASQQTKSHFHLEDARQPASVITQSVALQTPHVPYQPNRVCPEAAGESRVCQGSQNVFFHSQAHVPCQQWYHSSPQSEIGGSSATSHGEGSTGFDSKPAAPVPEGHRASARAAIRETPRWGELDQGPSGIPPESDSCGVSGAFFAPLSQDRELPNMNSKGGHGTLASAATAEAQQSVWRVGGSRPCAEESSGATPSGLSRSAECEQKNRGTARDSGADMEARDCEEAEDFSAFADHLSEGSTDDELPGATPSNADSELLPSKTRGRIPSATALRRQPRSGWVSTRQPARTGVPKFRSHSEQSSRPVKKGSGSSKESALVASNAPVLPTQRRDDSRVGAFKHAPAATSRGKVVVPGGPHRLNRETSRLGQKGTTHRGLTRPFPSATHAGSPSGAPGRGTDKASGVKGGSKSGSDAASVSKGKESASAASKSCGPRGEDASLAQHRTTGAVASAESDSNARTLPPTCLETRDSTGAAASGHASPGHAELATGNAEGVSQQMRGPRLPSPGPANSPSHHSPYVSSSVPFDQTQGQHSGVSAGRQLGGTGPFTSFSVMRAQSPQPSNVAACRRPRSTPPSAVAATGSHAWYRLAPWGARIPRGSGGRVNGVFSPFPAPVYQDHSTYVKSQEAKRYTTCSRWPGVLAVPASLQAPHGGVHFGAVPSAARATNLAVPNPVNGSHAHPSLHRPMSPQGGTSPVTNSPSPLRGFQQGPWFELSKDGRMLPAGWLEGSVGFSPGSPLPGGAGVRSSQTLLQAAAGQQCRQVVVSGQSIQAASAVHAAAVAAASRGNGRTPNAAGTNLQPSWSSQTRIIQNVKGV
ncbi:hypothetical protein NCLIV_021920 [Neospora caninum Liverpool]|nr:hypothetical protein NCLIV_021920 [Neospora caninum Liverpool]CBZ52403.1 hypothetical protein NCLIV_021920 [Neospora caninum Liverpool]|eukprot:XP_003882435.1 hypothetical protein NCLIV_021920 [Neospora caninum Liverpool]